jgi:L-rhamnose mutarotase
MNTYCAVYELNPGKINEYIELHENCWQEQLLALRESGAENLEIFLNGTQCIIFYECEDFDLFLEKLSINKVNMEWQQKMKEFFAGDVNLTGDQRIAPVKKVFGLKQKLGE